MKSLKLSFLALAVMLLLAGQAKADDIDFQVSATVPLANGVSITAVEVDAATNTFGSEVNELDFDPLTFDATNNIYVADHYYAIDVGSTGGAGSPDVTVTYTEGSKPSGQTNGLGYKATATFVKIEVDEDGDETQTEMSAHGPTQVLKDLTGEDVDSDELEDAFLRLYVGLVTGDDEDVLDDGGEPFTNADKPGSYDGTLTISATVS